MNAFFSGIIFPVLFVLVGMFFFNNSIEMIWGGGIGGVTVLLCMLSIMVAQGIGEHVRTSFAPHALPAFFRLGEGLLVGLFVWFMAVMFDRLLLGNFDPWLAKEAIAFVLIISAFVWASMLLSYLGLSTYQRGVPA